MTITRSVAALAILAAALIAGTEAMAAWCAQLRSGGTNCGFSTHAQCLAAVSGDGGTCTQSPDERPATRSPARPQRTEPNVPRQPKQARPPAPGAPSATPAPQPAQGPPAAQPTPQAGFAGARDLVLQGQYEAGIAALRALNFDDHPDVAAFTGLAYRKLNRLDDARAWYERALAADPGHKLALSYYGMLRAETGDLGRARADLEAIKRVCGGTVCNEYIALEAVIAERSR